MTCFCPQLHRNFAKSWRTNTSIKRPCHIMLAQTMGIRLQQETLHTVQESTNMSTHSIQYKRAKTLQCSDMINTHPASTQLFTCHIFRNVPPLLTFTNDKQNENMQEIKTQTHCQKGPLVVQAFALCIILMLFTCLLQIGCILDNVCELSVLHCCSRVLYNNKF